MPTPNSHINKKDLCIIPPAINIMKNNKILIFDKDGEVTPLSLKICIPDVSVTQPKIESGPNACVNS